MSDTKGSINTAYIEGKKKVASLFASRHSAKNTNDRLPPGQRLYDHMVAMPPIGTGYPHVTKEEWKIRCYGDVEKERTWDWNGFNALPIKDFIIDFHCVTRWSKLDQNFAGVPFAEIIARVIPKADVKHVIFECADGYTTNVPYQELIDQVAFIAVRMDGKDIEDKFGGPVRVVIPHLYGWKSAKFVNAIRFQSADEPGFWEVRGYHNHADAWKEERYSGSL